MRSIFFVISCAAAALTPLLPQKAAPPSHFSFPGWPETFEGRALMMLPLTQRERSFEAAYPGKIGRFSDGEREVVLRYVAEKTRKLHPSADCFKAIGYEIEPRPLWIAPNGMRWGSYKASRRGVVLWIYERIYDNAGNSWTDVSAWYWSALGGQTAGPWWAVTLAQSEPKELQVGRRQEQQRQRQEPGPL